MLLTLLIFLHRVLTPYTDAHYSDRLGILDMGSHFSCSTRFRHCSASRPLPRPPYGHRGCQILVFLDLRCSVRMDTCICERENGPLLDRHGADIDTPRPYTDVSVQDTVR